MFSFNGTVTTTSVCDLAVYYAKPEKYVPDCQQQQQQQQQGMSHLSSIQHRCLDIFISILPIWRSF